VIRPVPGGPVVVDTSVFDADLLKVRALLAASYQPFLVGRAVFISFVTVAELRYGARRGHALSQRVHEADRWVASTALWLGVPLVAQRQRLPRGSWPDAAHHACVATCRHAAMSVPYHRVPVGHSTSVRGWRQRLGWRRYCGRNLDGLGGA
jgi:hypothetical protein